MQLIRIILYAVSAIVLLSGISIFFGSSKREKGDGFRFLIATFGAALWTIAINIFLKMPGASDNFVHIIATLIIASITLCDIGLLAYLGWNYKSGKIFTLIFAVAGIVLIALLAYDSSLFYTSFDNSQDTLHLFVNKGWYYIALIVYFFLISITFSLYLQKKIKKTTNKDLKTGLKIFYVGLTIGGILALIFDLILLTAQPHLVWIGPMATSISILTFYYSTVKYRIVSMSSRWMEIMSYTIVIASTVILYLLAFYLVFNALFSTSNPTIEVIALNLIMAIILLLFVPTVRELTDFMRASYSTNKIALGYITKKLDRIDKSEFDPKDVSKFLAEVLHYSYFAIIIDKKVYSSSDTKFTSEEIDRINHLKLIDHKVWYPQTELIKDGVADKSISSVAILTNKSGKPIARAIFGKKLYEQPLSRREQIKQDSVINMLSAIIEESQKK